MTLRRDVAAADLLRFARGRRFATILADPPWQFTNRPERSRPSISGCRATATMKLDEIMALPVAQISSRQRRIFICGARTRCCPKGIAVMKAWGFNYKSNLVWHKVRKDGGSDGRGVGFYFRNVTELFCSACAARMRARLRRDGVR